jgi:hypothetical protein
MVGKEGFGAVLRISAVWYAFFPSTIPYLKGFHLTIDGWQSNQDEDGWRYYRGDIRELQEQGGDVVVPEPPEAPKWAKAKARLVECDLPALARLFGLELPPKRRVWSKRVAKVYYGFVDASLDGFGLSIQKPNDKTTHYRFGQWCDEISEKLFELLRVFQLGLLLGGTGG